MEVPSEDCGELRISTVASFPRGFPVVRLTDKTFDVDVERNQRKTSLEKSAWKERQREVKLRLQCNECKSCFNQRQGLWTHQGEPRASDVFFFAGGAIIERLAVYGTFRLLLCCKNFLSKHF